MNGPRQRARHPGRDGFLTNGASSRSVVMNLLIMLPLFFINRFGTAGNLAFFGVAYLLALRGCLGVVQALCLMAMVIVGNVALVTRGASFGALKFGLLLLAAGCLMTELRRDGIRLHLTPCYRMLWLFMGVAAILALLIDHHILISINKLVAFGIGFTVIFSISELAAYRRNTLTGWYTSFIVFVVVLAALAFGLGVGFNRHTTLRYAIGLFNGPTYHPQTFGPACALMIVYLVSKQLYCAEAADRKTGLLIALLLVCQVLTSSRTSVLALLIGLTVAVGYRLISSPGEQRVWRSHQAGNRVEILIVFVCVGLVLADLGTGGKIQEQAFSFVLKTFHSDHFDEYRQMGWDRVLYSRKEQVMEMSENIVKHPWMGIGFGISTSERFLSRVSLFSAPTEKGFLPVAVVEETGVIGACFFLLFVLSVYRHLLKRRNGPGLAMLSAMLGANLGEMMFFSFGGHGLLMWVMVGGGMALGATQIPSRSSQMPD